MPIIPLDNDMLRTILGALHDTKCELEEQCNAHPEEADINISDYTEEIIRITQVEVFLKAYLNRS